MEANANVVNKKKSFKEKFHDYMMGMSKIVPLAWMIRKISIITAFLIMINKR